MGFKNKIKFKGEFEVTNEQFDNIMGEGTKDGSFSNLGPKSQIELNINGNTFCFVGFVNGVTMESTEIKLFQQVREEGDEETRPA